MTGTGRVRTCMACAGLVLAVLAGSAAAETPTRGTFWYIIDNVTEVADGAEAVVWVTLPPAWEGQVVTVDNFVPEPVAVIEDPDSGNRVVEWRLAPEARIADPTERLWQFYFRYDYELRTAPVRKADALATGGTYDRSAPLVARYTREEIGLPLDGPVRDMARRIIGDERDPVRMGRLLYDWILGNLVFRASGVKEWDAASILAQREGNCEQFSTLYVALCRSVGIPARTLFNTWFWGGRHAFAEIMLPGGEWIPVDPALGQLLTTGRGGLTAEQVALTISERGVPQGDAGWLYGNAPGNLMVMSVGRNIRFRSPTLGREIVLNSMKPGGREAHPDGFRFDGFAGDLVHGGFYVFGDPVDEDAAHGLAHQRLANQFFRVDIGEFVPDECRAARGQYLTGVQNWINLGKSYLHKHEFYKADAAFSRALSLARKNPRGTQDAVVWIHNYLGNCYDLLDQREMAIEQYEAALAVGADFRGARKYARRHLERPFRMRD